MQGYLGGGNGSPYAAHMRRQRRRMRRRRRHPQRGRVCPDAQNYTGIPDLRPAVGRRHDTGTGGAGGRLLADRHALPLPEPAAAQRGPGHHRTAVGGAARQRHRLGAAQSLCRRRRLRRVPDQCHGEHERRARRVERVRYLEQRHLRPRRPDLQGSGTLSWPATTATPATPSCRAARWPSPARSPATGDLVRRHLAGNGVVGGSLALLPGSTYQAGRSERRQPDPGRRHRDAVRRHSSSAGIGAAPALGSAWPILTAAGGVSGSFSALTGRAAAWPPAPGSTLFTAATRSALVVTPSFYGNLAATGVAESRSEARRRRRAGRDPPRPRRGAGSRPGGAVRPALRAAGRQHHRGAR